MAYPVVIDVVPNVDSTISDSTVLQFSVTDTDNNLSRVIISAIYETGEQEVVYDGSSFSARYLTNSSKTAITDGFRFRIFRAGKWPSSPILRILAFDASVNIIEVDLQWAAFSTAKPLTDFPTSTPRSATTSNSVVARELQYGIILPFARDGKGDFANAGGVRLIGSNIRQILGTIASTGTSYGELEWMPEAGSTLDRLRHKPANEGTLALARLRVVDALKVYEPRVKILTAICEYAQDGDGRYALQIHMRYDILNSKDGGVIAANVAGMIR